MAKTDNLTDFLTDLADTIRTKKGTSGAINPQNFSSEIATIQTGTDISDTTATANDVLSGKDFYLANGTKASGNIQTYIGSIQVIPSTSTQYLSTQDKYLLNDITIEPIPNNYKDTTNADITANDVLSGKIAVNGSGYVTGNIQTYSGETNVTQNGTLATQGKYLNSDIIVNVASNDSGKYWLKVVDYDGTVLDSIRMNNGDTYTLPTPPTHSGLTFQEWTANVVITNNVVTCDDNNIMIGAIYTTSSGLNEFDIEITKAMEPDIVNNGYVVTLLMDGSKNWGDGTTDTNTTHTYYAYGKYTITTDSTTFSNSNTSIVGSSSVLDANLYLKNVRLATVTQINQYSFYYCRNLETITLSNNVSRITGTYICGNCDNLKCFIFPNGPSNVTNIIGNAINYMFSGCYSLLYIVLNKKMSQLGYYFAHFCTNLKNIAIPVTDRILNNCSNAFAYCYSLDEVVIPNIDSGSFNYSFERCYNLKTAIVNNTTQTGMFRYCYSLKSLTSTSSTPAIAITMDMFDGGNYAMKEISVKTNVNMSGSLGYCYALNKIVFYDLSSALAVLPSFKNILILDFSHCTQVPILNSGTSSTINKSLKIIVPDSLYSSWIIATNWSAFADYIYKASEVTL